jgi:hypothetical protein
MRRSAAALLTLVAGPAIGVAAESGTGDWRPYAVREEIAPRSWSEHGPAGELVLASAGAATTRVDGRWAREVSVAPGKDYAFRAEYRARRVASTARSVLARVVWLDAAGAPQRPMEYPIAASSAGPDGWTTVSGVYRVPAGVSRARLELHLRWTADGEVRWKGVDFRPSVPMLARLVKLATGTTARGTPCRRRRAGSGSRGSSSRRRRAGPTSSACRRV